MTATTDLTICPFEVHVPEEDLADLRRRIEGVAATRAADATDGHAIVMVALRIRDCARSAPLRVLDRHRPDRRLQRPASAPPALTRRQPPAGQVLYTAGIVQLRNDTAGRAYYRRKLAAGKTSMEAMRCLRRRLSDAVYRQLAADAAGQEEAGPGGHPGASLESSAAGLCPDTGPSDQPFPGPAPQTLQRPRPAPQPMAPAAAATRRRARGDGVERPTLGNDVDTDQRRHTLNSAGPCP
jgi:hypothetical protein